MDVIKEMQEMRAMKAQVEELAKQGMDPKDLNQKLQLPRKEWESDLAWKTRVLTLSYASDFIDAAEAKNIQLTFQGYSPDSYDTLFQTDPVEFSVAQ